MWADASYVCAQATQSKCAVSICISDSIGKSIHSASITISPKDSKMMLAFQNLGDTGCGRIAFSSNQISQVQIKVMASGFETEIRTIHTDSLCQMDKPLSLLFTLYPLKSSLPDVLVVPPTWVRGDTTFFRADAYKTGGERKLKDLIEKMPGFERNQEGILLYNKKAVEKITIEGEEIFADKMELMLNSFPVHVLEQVQALENQNNNPLLKGLKNENRVFVNLSLKKQGVKAAFGDGELALGTQGRYAFNPVIFALYNKLKAGFISNTNSLGNSFSGRIKQELLNTAQMESNPWMMAQYPPMAGQLDSKRYVQNQLTDNRLQLNFPLSKKLMLKNEIILIADKQKQSTNYQKTFLNQDSTFSNTDSNQYIGKPRMLYTNSKIEFKSIEQKLIRLEVQFFADLSSINKYSIIEYPNGEKDLLDEGISNTAFGGIIKGDYTYRVSEKKATLVNWYVHHHQFKQNGLLNNDQIGILYDIDSAYNQVNQNPALNHTKAYLQKEWLLQKKKAVKRFGMMAQYEQGTYNSQMNFTSVNQVKPSLNFSPLTYLFQQQNFRTAGYTQFAQTFKNLRINGKLKAGVIHQIPQNIKDKTQHIQLWIDTEWKAYLNQTKKISTEYTLKHEQDTRPLHYWVTNGHPLGIQNFKQYLSPDIAISRSQFDFAVNYKHRKWIRSLHANVIQNWNGNSNFSQVERYINFQVDSFINKANSQYRLAFHNTYNNSFEHLLFSIFTGYQYNQQWYNFRNTLYRGNNQFLYLASHFSKSWPQIFSVNAEVQLTGSKNQLPDGFSAEFEPLVYQFFTRSKLEYTIKKTWAIQSNHEFYVNNLNTANEASFYLTDIQISWTPLKGRCSYSFSIDNITNTERFFNQFNTPTLQAFYNFPLTPRNFMFYLRYTF